MTERTGEIGDPWGVPTSESIGSESAPLNLRRTLLSARKDSHHLTISGAKPKSLISCTSLGRLTLSKKPEMSKRHNPALSPA
jgi:hypothetical protein